MTDIEPRAERAGAALRDEARELVARMSRPGEVRGSGSPRRFAAVAAGMAVAVAATVVLVGDEGGIPVIDGVAGDPAAPVAVDGVLPVPEEGDVLAAYLEDGSPVFVAYPEAGEVLVLDALGTHDPGFGKLVAYCPSSGWFEDLYHGAKFTIWGDWVGGPAPSGLPAYPVELAADAATVRVTGPAGEAPAREDPRGERYEPRGPSCAPDESGSSDVIVAHRPSHPVTAVAGRDLPTDGWTWATVVVGGEPGRLVACEPDGTCPPDAPAVAADVNQPTGTLVDRTAAVYLARMGSDGAVELRRPAHPDDARRRASIAAEPLLALPKTGETSATYLADGTPVFVTRPDDDTLHVLDPTSPTVPAELVAWCGATGQFSHGGSTFGADGRPVAGPATSSLASYPHEVVAVGETAGIRITGEALILSEPHRTVTDPTARRCESGWLAHAPPADEYVAEQGTSVNHERWTWVRMPIAAVGDDLYLCSLGMHAPSCGEPSDTQTVCPDVDEDGAPAGCHPLADPRIVTPGLEPTDEPVLLLVRADPDQRTVNVRRPAGSPDDPRLQGSARTEIADFTVLAAARTEDPSLKGAVYRDVDGADALWEMADVAGPAPTLPVGTVGAFAIARDVANVCRGPGDIVGVEVVDGVVVLVLDPDLDLAACPGRSGEDAWTAFVVAIPELYDDGSLTGATTRIAGSDTGEASCPAITRFGKRAVDIGITYDYQPSTSPDELATWVDAVVLGTLTGESRLIEPGSADAGNPFVGYEVEVREVLRGDAPHPDRFHVFVEYSPVYVDGADLESVATPGVPVTVFGYEDTRLGDDAMLAAPMEGLVTGCPGEPLLGWFGTDGEWTDLDSLAEIADAVRHRP